MIVLSACAKARGSTPRTLEVSLLFPAVTMLIAILIVPALHAAPLAVPKPIAVLGTVDRVLTTVDLSGDGVPERIEFRADRRTFSIQTGQHIWSADPLGPSDRILIWDFDRLRRGVEFVHVGVDAERSNRSVEAFGARAFRWDEKQKTYSDPFYAYVRILISRPAEVTRVIDITQQAFVNWLGRRERAWRLLQDLQTAIKAGKATDGFFTKNSIKPIGWSNAVSKGRFTPLSYSEDEWKPVSYLAGKIGEVHVILLVHMDQKRGFKIAQIKFE